MADKNSTEKLGELIQDVKVAMMTTVHDGELHSRPMATLRRPFDGTLWFFTSATSGKVSEALKDHRVHLSYANPDDNTYVSVTGTANVTRDRQEVEKLWNPLMKAWFPKGVEDPDLAIMKVDVERAEYWDSPASAVVTLIGFVKAIATGEGTFQVC